MRYREVCLTLPALNRNNFFIPNDLPIILTLYSTDGKRLLYHGKVYTESSFICTVNKALLSEKTVT